MEQEAFLSVGW